MDRLIRVKVGQIIDTKGDQFIVQPKCEHNDGRWYCVTHKKLFLNQLEKDGHIHTGKHVMAWLCYSHSHPDAQMEVP